MRRLIETTILAKGMMLLLLGSNITAHSAPITPDSIPAVQGRFLGEDGAESADLSGIACPLEAASGPKRCLVVDDQTKLIQFSDLDASTFSASEEIILFDKAAPDNVVGAAPSSNNCKKTDDFKDLDGEGVTFDGPKVAYVVGSHGCGRNTDKFRASSFLLMKVDLHEATPVVTGTFRLSEIFANSGRLQPNFTKMLSKNGLNIEGIAAVGGLLYFGLRAPIIDDSATLVAVSADDLFQITLNALKYREIPVYLGPNTGIRDLAPLADGRLLILAGPTQSQELHYRMFVTNPLDGSSRQLAILEDVTNGNEVAKAEGVTVLGVHDGILKVAVVYDGIIGGGLRTYSMPLDLPK
jgi:hypothetical protein